MSIRNLTMRNTLATAYKGAAVYGALFTADPGTSGSATGEVSGGSYARQAANWGTASASAVTSGSMAFPVPAGTTVTYLGFCTSSTGGTADVQDSVSVPSQTFASAGTYTVTATFTQS